MSFRITNRVSQIIICEVNLVRKSPCLRAEVVRSVNTCVHLAGGQGASPQRGGDCDFCELKDAPISLLLLLVPIQCLPIDCINRSCLHRREGVRNPVLSSSPSPVLRCVMETWVALSLLYLQLRAQLNYYFEIPQSIECSFKNVIAHFVKKR